MTELIPIKVKIGLKQGRRGLEHAHPDFNQLPSDVRSNMDWSQYVDSVGGGWHYDQCCGHHDIDAESPNLGEWIGCLLVPEAFAETAVGAFPDQVEVIDEAAFEHFHDTRAHVREPDEHVDEQVVNAIAAKRAAGVEETQADRDALDPDNPKPGIRRNVKKTWSGRKTTMGVTIANAGKVNAIKARISGRSQ